MLYIPLVLIVLILFFLAKDRISKTKEVGKQDRLRKQWGLPKDEYFNFDVIELFSQVSNENYYHHLNEQTRKDIDFYELFSFIDRTTSKPGQQILFDRLTKPTNNIGLLQRLNAHANTFVQNKDLREQAQRILLSLNEYDAYYITSLLKPNVVTKPTWATFLLPDSVLTIILFVLVPFYHWVAILLMPLFAINLFLHYRNKNNTFQFNRSFPQLNILINACKQLTKLDIPFNKTEADESIKKLKTYQQKFRILNFGQAKGEDLAQVVYMVLELVKATFLVEVIAFYSLAKVLENRKQDILRLFTFAGEIDVSISIASLRSGAQQTCMPGFIDSAKEIRTKNVCHPLIENCVANSIDIYDKGVLVTGSNMSGKTTFLRTVAVNSVLAQTIYTCFAEEFTTPVLKLFSSIRIDDNLLAGKSYYMAEVNTMDALIKEADSGHQNLFILDEVFKGTNTVERIASAKAILSYLNKHNNIVMVSTHDMELSQLLYNEYDLYHFEEKIVDDRLIFDHLIKAGPLRTRNAIKILELSGYPEEIIKEANSISKTVANANNIIGVTD